MRPSELQLNRIAQGLVTTAAGVSWFESLSATEQASVLKDLSFICVQAHPRREEFSEAIARSSLKQSFTPCVVLQTATTPSVAISKIASLTEIGVRKILSPSDFSVFSRGHASPRNTLQGWLHT